jgi:hypothetical protein
MENFKKVIVDYRVNGISFIKPVELDEFTPPSEGDIISPFNQFYEYSVKKVSDRNKNIFFIDLEPHCNTAKMVYEETMKASYKNYRQENGK